MKTTQFAVSTKNGESQALRFLVVQNIPYPCITSECGSLRWSNGGGLFDHHGAKASGIGTDYTCFLLADTAPEEIPADYNRTLFAGYVDYHDRTKINGGTFKLRGRDLGEMSISFELNPDWQNIKINGYDAPSAGERAAISELICPVLRRFISENKAELKAEAVATIRARFAAQLSEARKAIDALELKAKQVVY